MVRDDVAIAREFASAVGGWIVRKQDVPFIAFVRIVFDLAKAAGASVPSGDDFERTNHAIGPFMVLTEPVDLVVAAHEGEHVGQFWRGEYANDAAHEGRSLHGGLAFAWLYLVNPLARIRFEMRAFRAGAEVAHALGYPAQDAADFVERMFASYALPEEHRAFTLQLAASMLSSVDAGVVTTDAGKAMIAILRRHGAVQ